MSIEEYLPLATKAANMFLKRHWWLKPQRDEVYAEANLYLVQLAQHYDPAISNPDTYFLQRIVGKLSDQLVRKRNPATGSTRHKPEPRWRTLPLDALVQHPEAPAETPTLLAEDEAAILRRIVGRRDWPIILGIIEDRPIAWVSARMGLRDSAVHQRKKLLLQRLARRRVLEILDP